MTSIAGIIGVNEEKKYNLGEDSALRLLGTKASVIASFDGCGGSGSKRYPAAQDWTGAKIAAHTCANALGDWFEQNEFDIYGFGDAHIESIADGIKSAVKIALNDVHQNLGDVRSLIKGSLSSALPTTMSAITIEQARSEKIRCIFFWAGDSRGYLFTVKGLRQMTKDDSQAKTDDDDFIADGVLSNVISLQNDFVIQARETLIDSPAVVLTVTDGCYAYYETPMDFEGVLLETLMEATSLLDWEQLLKDRIGLVASDDYTLQMAIIGYETFKSLKSAFYSRANEYRRIYGDPILQMLSQNDRIGLKRLWNEYKKFYR